MENKTNLLGISGRISSGKDTVGKIIQYLICLENGVLAPRHLDFKDFGKAPISNEIQSGFKVKKFADKLKDCVCLILGCTRQQLESEDFKNSELGKEWWYYIYNNGYGKAMMDYNRFKPEYHVDNESNFPKPILVKLTPRLLLQLMGTECGREILHPNIWVNASFADYKDEPYQEGTTPENLIWVYDNYPNWIFTDMRFPNELEAIKSRGGVTIRVNRIGSLTNQKPIILNSNHPSETSLDSAEFDYTIINDGSLEELIEKVKEILKKENII